MKDWKKMGPIFAPTVSIRYYSPRTTICIAMDKKFYLKAVKKRKRDSYYRGKPMGQQIGEENYDFLVRKSTRWLKNNENET